MDTRMKILPKIVLLAACLNLSWSSVSCADLDTIDLKQAGLEAYYANDYGRAAIEIQHALNLAKEHNDPAVTGDLYFRLALIQ